MRAVVEDVRNALRTVWRHPSFVLVAAGILALGIGVNVALVSVADVVLVRPLPYAEPDRLVMVEAERSDGGTPYLSWPELDFIKRNGRLLQSAGGIRPNYAEVMPISVPLTDGPLKEEVQGIEVTPDLLPTLGIEPLAGRHISDADLAVDGNNAQGVLISHELWTRRYDRDLTVVGKSIETHFRPRQILGVLPPKTKLLLAPEFGVPVEADCWYPSYRGSDAGNRYLRTVARLRSGVSLSQAQAEMDALSRSILRALPEAYEGADVRFRLTPMGRHMSRQARPVLLALLGAGLFLLLIVCANVSNLVLARSHRQAREWALRSALGAGRGRLIRQIVMEGITLAVLGGAGGLLMAHWGSGLVLAMAPSELPRIDEIQLDRRVLAFSLFLTLAAGVAVGLIPALRVVRANLFDALRRGGRRFSASRAPLREVLTSAQIAFSLALLAGTGLMMRSWINLNQVELGFRPGNVVVFKAPFNFRQVPLRGQGRWDFHRQIVERVEALPGVTSAGGIFVPPTRGTRGGFSLSSYRLPSDEAEASPRRASFNMYLPGYFKSLGIELLAGRLLSPRDDQEKRLLVLVDERMARQTWPDQNPVGQTFQTDFVYNAVLKPQDGQHLRTAEVAGVVANLRQEGLRSDALPQVYVPYWTTPYWGMHMVARTTGDPLSLTGAIETAVKSVENGQFIHSVTTLDSLVAEETAQNRFSLTLLALLGGAALVIASVGLFAVMSQSVAQRTREIGIRLSLGAVPHSILGLVIRRGMAVTLSGLAAGLLLSAGLTGLLSSQLFGVTPLDALTFASVSGLLLAAAFLACTLPARRASRIDPVLALKSK